MQHNSQHLYEFGPFRVDPAERRLLREGQPVPLTAKAFDTLLVLVQRNGHLVEKPELINAVWSGTFVEEGNLTVVICTLRKALGDDNSDRKYIQTVAKRGYRFVGEVREIVEPAAELPAAAPDIQVPPPQVATAARRHAALPRALTLSLFLVAFAAILLVVVRSSIWNTAASAADIRSIAVLPFISLNGPSTPDYLSVGIADAIITRLGNTGQIVVRPTSAVLKYAQTPADPRVVGKEQKVDAILQGHIEVLPNSIRVRVQLVRVRDGALLWADTFEEKSERMFMLEEEVAERFVRSAPFRLSGSAKERLVHADTTNPKAYQHYMEGRYLFNKRTEQSALRSLESFQQAISNDRQYAMAYAGLADAYVVLGTYGEPPWNLYPNAKAAMLKALELDDSLAAAHASRAMIAFHYEWNWADAEHEFERAISLNPNDPMVRAWYAMFLGSMGRHAEALSQAQRAKELDPVSPIVGMILARVFYWHHDYDQAIEVYSRIIELDPQFGSAHARLGMTYLAKGAVDQAIHELEEAQRLSGADPYQEGLLAYAYALAGQSTKARETAAKLALRSNRKYVPALSIAFVYVGLGDRDRALEWLSRSYQDRSTHMVYSKVDPLLDPLRSDPRFSILMRQMGL